VWAKTLAVCPPVVRRNAELREVSLTWRPAYPGAVMSGLSDHTSDWAEDRALVTSLRMWRAADEVRQARRRTTCAI
jgi:phage head maturation protease